MVAKNISLSESSVAADPFIHFGRWYSLRLRSVDDYPDAFSLATASLAGKVSVRTVLLKAWDNNGFVFFTNYNSHKGRDISENPNAAMLFYWPESGRQVRVEGNVEIISSEESDQYFNSRPRLSRVGAWASNQSSVIKDRDFLDSQVASVNENFKGKKIPRPAHWGGFRIVPFYFEFWQEGRFRLHDRIFYKRTAKGWETGRLSP